MSYCISPSYSTRNASVAGAPRSFSPASEERFIRPTHDFSETPEAYVLTAQVPGVSKDTLETVVKSDHLVVTGRKTWQTPEGAVALVQEIQPYHYRIALRLDNRVDVDKIKAELRNGVLTVTLPKAESTKPRHIVVES